MPEYFETFDDNDIPTGLLARDEVHSRGLWHRSAHVFLFTSDNELYVQRRAANKDLCPGCWDFSVGEHLQPGETYLDGARRGLAEELGVTGVALQPIGGLHRASNSIPELGVLDREVQQAFSGYHDGVVRPDPEEVSEVACLPAEALRTWMERSPEAFTPWFLHEVTRLGLLRPT